MSSSPGPRTEISKVYVTQRFSVVRKWIDEQGWLVPEDVIFAGNTFREGKAVSSYWLWDKDKAMRFKLVWG